MILTNDNYPVFEADQVLHQKHLNTLTSYLEEQDRASHLHLMGMGIACGLEVQKPNASTIRINCGSAITSLGYLIPFDTKTYTHFKITTIADDFLTPDIDKQPYLSSLYEYTQPYRPFKDTIELLETEATDDGKEVLTPTILKNKAILLLLETALIDEKNCVTIDCADKGKRLQFKVRPLLIDEDLLDASEFYLNTCFVDYFKKLVLPKYNVPKTKLVTGEHVLNAFDTLINASKKRIGAALLNIHKHFEGEYGELLDFIILKTVASKIAAVHSLYKSSIQKQYVWDWLVDLAATYNEIASFHACNKGVCCPDKTKFPFHVLLGSTEFATAKILPENKLRRFRTDFIKAGLLSEEERNKKELLKVLFEKLIHQVMAFEVDTSAVRENGIKITPSLFGNIRHSKRAIPHYYKGIASLSKKWSPELSLKNETNQLLGYHSNKYNGSDDHVLNPLRYDLEPYNFFRVEGHLGQNYDAALTEIMAQQQRYRLPFKVVALNAMDYSGKTIDIANQKAVWDDMELDYDLAKEKVYNITEYVISWIKDNKAKIQAEYSAMTDQAISGLEEILVESRKLLVDDLKNFLPNYEAFYEVFDKLNSLFLSHRLCISLFPDIAEKSIIEDFVDHLDEINILFLEDPFTIIHEEAERRWEALFKETFLSKFLEKHAAITHKAGVSKGGTFVMIYKDSSVFRAPKIILDTTFLLGRITNYMTLFDFSESQKKTIFEANVVRKRAASKKKKLTPKPIDETCKDAITNVKNEVLSQAKINMFDLPKSTQDFILDKFVGAFDTNAPGILSPEGEVASPIISSIIPERKVFADFYLPYICCSEGNNINIVLPPAESSETGLVDFNADDFNANDFFANPE